MCRCYCSHKGFSVKIDNTSLLDLMLYFGVERDSKEKTQIIKLDLNIVNVMEKKRRVYQNKEIWIGMRMVGRLLLIGLFRRIKF